MQIINIIFEVLSSHNEWPDIRLSIINGRTIHVHNHVVSIGVIKLLDGDYIGILMAKYRMHLLEYSDEKLVKLYNEAVQDMLDNHVPRLGLYKNYGCGGDE